MKEIVVVGAGGFGREVLDIIRAKNVAGHPEIRVRGVVDKAVDGRTARLLEVHHGVAHLGTDDEWFSRGNTRYDIVLGIGDPGLRSILARRYQAHGHRPLTLIHPSADIGSGAILGPGTVICGGAQVSTNVTVGPHSHINPNVTIGHDVRLGDYVSLNPGALVSGHAWLGDRVLVGAGAVILQGLRVGAGATVGAAACVTRDVAPSDIVSGVPARRHTS